MVPIKILLVEDEIDLAYNLKELLENLDFTVVGIFEKSDLVLDYLKINKVDIILTDIMLKGKQDGIELARQIKSQFQMPIVFITAYSDNEVLKSALEVEPDGYLLKPFNKENLNTTIALAFNNFNSKIGKNVRSVVANNVIQIRDKGFKLLIPIDDIIVAKADGLYTKIITKNKSYLVRYILKDVKEKLPENQFMRVHKSFIVNKNYIDSFNSKFIMIKDQMVPIRRGYFKVLKNIKN
jgi:two-component system, LytTR family, response regulator LytT